MPTNLSPAGRIRPVYLSALAMRDALRTAGGAALPVSAGVRDQALAHSIDWLCASHDVTGRQGSSKAFTLLHGWLPAYPETTGYVLGTLLEQSRRLPARTDLRARAVEMGAWEAQVQEPDGGIMEGHVETRPRRSIVFNTGMVLHGWVDLLEAGEPQFEAPARRAAEFLVAHMSPDGTWRAELEYSGIPHTYNTRVAWAMVRWGQVSGDEQALEAARRQLDWAVSSQQPGGWFANCAFRPDMAPSTHAIAYTLRGLLESYSLTGEARWLETVQRTAEALLPVLDRHRLLPATYRSDWQPAARYSCLTGTVQLGGVWLRLYQETGEPRWLRAGLRAVEQAAAYQETTRWSPLRGAIAGSSPIWGRYAPLQYPNWATKFLADGLMLYEDCLNGSREPGVKSVTPGPRGG